MVVIKKLTAGEGSDKREPSYATDGNVIYYRYYRMSLKFLTNPQIDFPYYLALLVLDIYP